MRAFPPGIYHARNSYHYDPEFPVYHEIVVDPTLHPFAAGETPHTYAARIVALVAPGGRVISVTMQAQAGHTLPPAPPRVDGYDQRIDIVYSQADGR